MPILISRHDMERLVYILRIVARGHWVAAPATQVEAAQLADKIETQVQAAGQ